MASLPQELLQSGLIWRADSSAESPAASSAMRTWQNQDSHDAAFSAMRTCQGQDSHDAVDSLFYHGGLTLKACHEFFSLTENGLPPHTLLSVLSRANRQFEKGGFEKLIVWVGRELWPTPYSLGADNLTNHLFINPPDNKLSLWCTETLLRSPAVGAVIAGLSKLSFAMSRKLSLAAKKAEAVAFIVRPFKELSLPSSAATRWIIKPYQSDSNFCKWQLDLARCKGIQPVRRSWILEERFQSCSPLIDSSGGAHEESGPKIHLSIFPAMVDQSCEMVGEKESQKSRAAGFTNH
jgi:hypothetical protein